MKNRLKIYPILLAGGSGTRLWPVSRELYPKQLVKFIGENSLVQNTIKRLPPSLDVANVRIVCGEEHVHEIERHIKEIGVSPENKIIAEPCGRNTAPAILLAMRLLNMSMMPCFASFRRIMSYEMSVYFMSDWTLP